MKNWPSIYTWKTMKYPKPIHLKVVPITLKGGILDGDNITLIHLHSSLYYYIWKPSSQNELTPYRIQLQLPHLGSEASK